jgi:hypothetical protein
MIAIRPLTPQDDLRDLIALSRAFFAEYAEHHSFFAVDMLQDEDITGFFARTLNSDTGVTFLALADGKIVGYLAAFVREQAGFSASSRWGPLPG